MFDIELALLHQRFESIESKISIEDFSDISFLEKYFQLILDDLRTELTELNDDMTQTSSMNKSTTPNQARYYQSISNKIAKLRTLMSTVDRDLPISRLVLEQCSSKEYQWLDAMAKESLGSCNPGWVLCLWDEFKCLLPRQSLMSKLPAFTFVIFPESATNIPLLYPILFHEIGHSALLTSTNYPNFKNLNAALDAMDQHYSIRILGAGSGSRKKLTREWEMKRSWDLWGRELFCDYYALLAAGPAYLQAMSQYLGGSFPFEVAQTHPPLQLRFDVTRRTAERMGIADESINPVIEKWERLKVSCSYQETQKYRLVNDASFIDAVIDDIQNIVHHLGVDKRNYWESSESDPITVRLVNDAWQKVLSKDLSIGQANLLICSSLSQI